MKYLFILLCTSLFVFSSCNNSKKNAASAAADPAQLEGNWELNYITGPRIAFAGLYPSKKPVIRFEVNEKRVSGNTSCNSYSGKFTVYGNKIDLSGPLAVTKMFCGGQGEPTFLETLKKINGWSVEGNILTLMIGDIPGMKFTRK